MSLALASVFSSHMVLQQGKAVPVWGTAKAGSRINVQFGSQQVSAAANGDGNWQAELAPLTACSDGDDLVVSIESSDEAVVCNDVLVGEVWVCSGQSNMGFTVSQADDPAKHIAEADAFNKIRLLQVPHRLGEEPQTRIEGETWSVCSADSVAEFSAVGYFFGLELHRKLGVPIGLINSSWGGTICEAWTSREGLKADVEGAKLVEDYEAGLPLLPDRMAEYEKAMSELHNRTSDKTNLGFDRGWAGNDEPADGEWGDMSLPGTWQHRGLVMSGVLWFRKVVDIPQAWAGKDLSLAIGATDKSDVTYFNNEQVGSVTMADRDDSWSFQRVYKVPGKLVKAGRNVIAVRVHSNMQAGGMTGPAEAMYVSSEGSSEGDRISLAGNWRYAIEADYGLVQRPAAPAGPGVPNRPCVLYNGMIRPLLPMAIRGAIWYQGESNASRAKQYRNLFPALINDWRNQWQVDDMPFYFVQLANYGPIKKLPDESNWAELREAQAMTLKLPHTGMAVSIDIGNPQDIHPTNKQDVGLRLALSALHQTYGRDDVTPSGPLFRKAVCEGPTMRLFFDHVAGGLVSEGGDPRAFSIAGSDGKFVWADAKIDGDSVVVCSPSVKQPQAVRYGWAESPDCNLYNAAGLPASPFRTDVD